MWPSRGMFLSLPGRPSAVSRSRPERRTPGGWKRITSRRNCPDGVLDAWKPSWAGLSTPVNHGALGRDATVSQREPGRIVTWDSVGTRRGG